MRNFKTGFWDQLTENQKYRVISGTMVIVAIFIWLLILFLGPHEAIF